MRGFGVVLALAVLVAVATPAEATDTWWVHDPDYPGDWFDSDNWTQGVPTSVAIINNGGTALIGEGTATVTSVYVAYDTASTCRVVQSGGALMGSTATYESIELGCQEGSRGEYELSGDGYVQTWQLMLGDKGTGVFSQSGGNVSASVFMGMNATAAGIYEMSAGTLNAPFFEMCGEGQGRFTLIDGTVTAGYFHVGYSFGEALCELQGGSVAATAFSVGTGNTWGASIPPSTGTCRISNAAHLAADTLVVGGYGTGILEQTGGTVQIAGTLYLAERSTGTGRYEASGGSLHADTCRVGSAGGAALAVRGAEPNITFGTYEQTDSGELLVEVDAQGIAVIAVSGQASLSGTLTVTDLGAPLGRFDILAAQGGIAGNFATVELPAADWSYGVTNNMLWVEHVPEPATLSLVALGGLALLRRRRK